jgi:hypothetical protein
MLNKEPVIVNGFGLEVQIFNGDLLPSPCMPFSELFKVGDEKWSY